jgi:hypothetical protein
MLAESVLRAIVPPANVPFYLHRFHDSPGRRYKSRRLSMSDLTFSFEKTLMTLPWQAVGNMRHTRQAVMASVLAGVTATPRWRESNRLITDQNGAVWERLRHPYQRESTHKRDTRPEQGRKPDSRSFPIMEMADLKSIHGVLWLSVEVDSNRTCSGSSRDIGINGTTLINST